METKHKILFSAEALQKRIEELGQQISDIYKGQKLTTLGLLDDSFIFYADLIRAIKCPLACAFTYVKKHTIGDHLDINYTSEVDLSGRNILVVGDIIDTGITFDYLTKQLSIRNPKSIKLCVLLDRPESRQVDIQPDFVAFQTTEERIFGYGLGLQGMYRQLPFLAIAEGN